ncbi:hypothetical protein IGB42_01291 [Andreprevotia sp. IGB-42]|nr:hypothetical protein IGB42_01291 [Andreprevotia sp. IGB-42]
MLFLIVRMPASLFIGFLPKPWQAGDVRGTLWHGQAAQFGANGQLLVSDLRWDWQAAELLRGKLAWQISTLHNQTTGHALLGLELGGLKAENVDVLLPLAPLLALDAKMAPLQIGGNLAIQAKAASEHDWDGVVLTLSDAHAMLTPQANPFGSYRVDTQRKPEGIAWKMRPLQGILHIDGQGVIKPGGKPQGQLHFVPAKGQEALFAPLMASLGGSSAGYTLQLGGQ